MPLHHVSFRGRGSLVGPRPVRYFSVAAPTAADALRIVEEQLNGEPGSYEIARAKGEATSPGILAYAQLAA